MVAEQNAAQETKSGEPIRVVLPADFLIRMHEFTAAELTRYRDVQWQVPSVVMVFLFSLCGAIGTDYVGDLIRSRPYRLQGGFTVLIVALCAFVMTFIWHTEVNRIRMYKLLVLLESDMKVGDYIKAAIEPGKGLSKKGKSKRVLVYPACFITLLASVLSLCLLWFKK